MLKTSVAACIVQIQTVGIWIGDFGFFWAGVKNDSLSFPLLVNGDIDLSTQPCCEISLIRRNISNPSIFRLLSR